MLSEWGAIEGSPSVLLERNFYYIQQLEMAFFVLWTRCNDSCVSSNIIQRSLVVPEQQSTAVLKHGPSVGLSYRALASFFYSSLALSICFQDVAQSQTLAR